MKIHAIARWPHLADHIVAIHQHLDDDLRGEVLIGQGSRAPKTWAPDDIVMVAAFGDIAAARGRRVIYVEHGAGQSYLGANPGAARYYHGSDHPENVVGYISPRQDVADSWGRPAFAAGAPICDPYELFASERIAAITFHWNGAPPNKVGVPEAGTAFEHYVDRLDDITGCLRENGWQVLGHYHPRFAHMHSVWKKLGIEIASADEVRRNAQLLIADNTSLMYEMLYLWRDVIALNAPWYRRDVEHGLRFWHLAPAIQADDADELIDIISDDGERAALVSGSDIDIVEQVYGKAHSDGLDGQRAAAWVTMLAASI